MNGDTNRRLIGDVGGLEDGWASVKALPPLPTPKHWERRSEACCGFAVVAGITFIFVSVTHMTVWTVDERSTVGSRICLLLVYLEAAVAALCFGGLMFGDPGVIERSPATCFPMPEEVAVRVRANQSLDDLSNITRDGRTFCVRCLVWRPEGKATHHCDACQRCVTDFDHHCGVFGRCIAGEGFKGNMGYFKTIIAMAGAAVVDRSLVRA